MSQSCHQSVFHIYFLKFEMTLKVENLKEKKKKGGGEKISNSSQNYLYTSVTILKGEIYF